MPWHEITWPLVGAIVAGGLIGLEREWRGRPAGFRTHILVSLSSCLLMLAALHQTHWAFDDLPRDNIMTDPTRMAHGVLTGIGFLCAGVIFRQGFSVHGLTTAASLWMTAALGLLFGAGLIGLATVATLVTVTILVGLKLVSSRMPSWHGAQVEVRWARGDAETAKRVLEAVTAGNVRAAAGTHGADASLQRCNWRLRARDRKSFDLLAGRLATIEGVQGFEIETYDD